MISIGILAYGSLIEDQGKELKPLVLKSIQNVKTPFHVEFARSSNSRDGAPTLIPVEDGGAQVQGVILVLDPTVTVPKAENLLWRRETRNEETDKHYQPSDNPGTKYVVIKHLQNLENVETVLFTKIGKNIENCSPENLADLAISSARKKADEKQKDGISYLISVKKQGIQTPLMPEYEAAILQKTKSQTLQEAYDKIRPDDA